MMVAMTSPARSLAALVLPALMLFGAQACGGSAPAAPTPPGVFEGSWAGSMNDSAAGAGSIRLELADATGSMRGTWSARILNSSTTWSGTLMEYQPAASSTTRGFDCGCTEERKGVLTLHFDGQKMTGRYFFTDCAGLSFGTMDLTQSQ